MSSNAEPDFTGRVGAAEAAEILDVLARYAQVIDNRDWDYTETVFTSKMSFGKGAGAASSHAELQQRIESVSPYHPHYSVNTVLHKLADGRVKAWTKFFLVRTDGTAGSGDYLDTLVRTADGWRIQLREVSRGNRSPSDPGGASQRHLSSAQWRSAPEI